MPERTWRARVKVVTTFCELAIQDCHERVGPPVIFVLTVPRFVSLSKDPWPEEYDPWLKIAALNDLKINPSCLTSPAFDRLELSCSSDHR